MEETIKHDDAEKAVDTHGSTPWYIPHHTVHAKRRSESSLSHKVPWSVIEWQPACWTGPGQQSHWVTLLVSAIPGGHYVWHREDVSPWNMNEQDCDFLQFSWWEGSNLSMQTVDYRMKVHLFGATSSPGCANYGLKHLAKENKAALPLGSNCIEHNFYVDDGLVSEPTEEQAIQVVEQARSLCASGGLRLHKFVSNNCTVMESIHSVKEPQISRIWISTLPTCLWRQL